MSNGNNNTKRYWKDPDITPLENRVFELGGRSASGGRVGMKFEYTEYGNVHVTCFTGITTNGKMFVPKYRTNHLMWTEILERIYTIAISGNEDFMTYDYRKDQFDDQGNRLKGEKIYNCTIEVGRDNRGWMYMSVYDKNDRGNAGKVVFNMPIFDDMYDSQGQQLSKTDKSTIWAKCWSKQALDTSKRIFHDITSKIANDRQQKKDSEEKSNGGNQGDGNRGGYNNNRGTKQGANQSQRQNNTDGGQGGGGKAPSGEYDQSLNDDDIPF